MHLKRNHPPGTSLILLCSFGLRFLPQTSTHICVFVCSAHTTNSLPLFHSVTHIETMSAMNPCAELDAAKNLLDNYRNGQEPAGTTEEQIWRAKVLYDSAFHPQTGEKNFFIGRMSCQVIKKGWVLIVSRPLSDVNRNRRNLVHCVVCVCVCANVFHMHVVYIVCECVCVCVCVCLCTHVTVMNATGAC